MYRQYHEPRFTWTGVEMSAIEFPVDRRYHGAHFTWKEAAKTGNELSVGQIKQSNIVTAGQKNGVNLCPLPVECDDVGAVTETLTVEELENQRRERKPFWYCRLVADHPFRCFFITLGMQISLVLVSGILLLSGYDLFPAYFETLPVQLYSVPYLIRDFANRDKDQYANKFSRDLVNSGYPNWERGLRHPRSSLDVYYSTESGNIFSKENLQRIYQIEADVVTASGYSSSWCQTNSSSLYCVKPVSILRYFDGTYSGINSVFDDPTFSNVTGVLYEANSNTQTKEDFLYFLPKSYIITPTIAQGAITRSIIPIGCSSSGYKACSTMEKKAGDFLYGSLKEKLEYWRERVTSFEMWYYGYVLWSEDMVGQAMLDMALAVGSMVFIFSFMTFHTRSLWMSSFGVMSILTSFVGGNLIYRCIFDFRYFGFFHVIAIFITLGIGADDLFVFYDAWRLTAFHSYPTLGHRLSDAYSKSAKSMAITSFTTMVAFLCSAISPLLATKSFGVFAAIVIMFNYMAVIIFFPCVVTVYHLKYETFSWLCCGCRRRKDTGNMDNVNNISEQPTQNVFVISSEKSNIKYDEKNGISVIEDVEDKVTVRQKGAIVNGVVSTGNNPDTCMDYRNLNSTTKKDRNGVVVNGVVSTGNKPDTCVDYRNLNPTTKEDRNGAIVNGVVSTGNKPDTCVDYRNLNPTTKEDRNGAIVNGMVSIGNKPDKCVDYRNLNPTTKKDRSKEKKLAVFFRDYYFLFITHRLTRWCLLPVFVATVTVFAYQASSLVPDNENMNVWKESHHFTKAMDAGQYRFLASEEGSLRTVQIVWGLKNKDRSDCHFSDFDCRGTNVYDGDFDPNPVANQHALMNFCDTLYGMSAAELAALDIKIDSNGNPEIACFTRDLGVFLANVSRTLSIDLSLPWDHTKVSNLMAAEPSHFDASKFNSSFPNILEIAVQYWLYSRYTKAFTPDYGKYNSLFGEETGAWSQPLLSDSSIYYGNNIKYLMVSVNTTISLFTTGYTEGIPKVERWENFIQSQVKKMPPGVQGGFQLTLNLWHWLYVQREMERNAITGIAVGVSLAFPILCLSTMNLIVGSLATLSICCTTVCVIGVIPSAGWKLGILTSLNMTMLVGLAVDFVVHLADGYMNSLHTDRLSRTRDMLEAMGMSVFAGACTTLGAAAFMFFAELTFFIQFGIFLFSTIGFSLLFSLGLFSILMGLIGPQNNTGSLKPVVIKIKRLFKKCP